MARIKFMNIELDNFTMEETLSEIDRLIQARQDAYLITTNVDNVVQLDTNVALMEAYQAANVVVADGMPLLWMSKLYKTPIKEKVSGADLFPKLCEMASQKGYSMFFLGAEEGIAAKAAENLKKRYPQLNVVDTYSPPFGFEKDKDEVDKIIKLVTTAKPDILVVALGCPKQECFIYKYRKQLGVPISMGLGASIDFEAGNKKRAPKWMSEHGLEWFYRLSQEPKRMAKRYFVDDIKIVKLFLKYRKEQ